MFFIFLILELYHDEESWISKWDVRVGSCGSWLNFDIIFACFIKIDFPVETGGFIDFFLIFW